MTSSVTNDGEVKMNSSSETFSNSLRSASNAKIENVDAAIRTFEPGTISFLRSSPRRSLTLSMIRTRLLGILVVRRGRSAVSAHPFVDLTGLELPEAPDLVGGHGPIGYPGVGGVFCDPEVGGDVVCGQPRLSHVGPPSLDDPDKSKRSR